MDSDILQYKMAAGVLQVQKQERGIRCMDHQRHVEEAKVDLGLIMCTSLTVCSQVLVVGQTKETVHFHF